MLPEFPLLNEAFSRAVHRVLDERIRARQGIFGTVGRARMFEGERNIIVRPDGSDDPTVMREGRAELRISFDEMKGFGIQELLTRFEYIAEEMARQQSAYFLDTLSEGSKKAGTTIDAQGAPLTPQLLLRILETIQISFTADGVAQMPTILVSPGKEESVKAVIKELESNPELKKMHDNIFIKKREEWNAREADRILVG